MSRSILDPVDKPRDVGLGSNCQQTLNQDKKNNYSETVRGTEFLVEPSDCRPWKFHNRDNIWMNVDKCQDLISSIRKNGQKVPIFARKIENDPDGKNWKL